MSSLLLGRTDAAPSNQRTAHPKKSAPNTPATTANGVSESTASPVRRRAAPDRTHQRDQRERLTRSLPIRKARNAVSMTSVVGFLPCITARATVPCSPCQMLAAATAPAAAATAATAALRALRASLLKRVNSATTTNASAPMVAATDEASDSQRGMCTSHRETSFETSVLPMGSSRMRPRVITTTPSANSERSRSAGRRTRSEPRAPWCAGVFTDPCSPVLRPRDGAEGVRHGPSGALERRPSEVPA